MNAKPASLCEEGRASEFSNHEKTEVDAEMTGLFCNISRKPLEACQLKSIAGDEDLRSEM